MIWLKPAFDSSDQMEISCRQINSSKCRDCNQTCGEVVLKQRQSCQKKDVVKIFLFWTIGHVCSALNFSTKAYQLSRKFNPWKEENIFGFTTKESKKKKTNPQAPMVGLVVKTWNIWIWALLKSWDSKPLWYYQFLWIARLSAPLALPRRRRRTWARTQRSYNRSLSTKSCFRLQKEWRGSSN